MNQQAYISRFSAQICRLRCGLMDVLKYVVSRPYKCCETCLRKSHPGAQKFVPKKKEMYWHFGNVESLAVWLRRVWMDKRPMSTRRLATGWPGRFLAVSTTYDVGRLKVRSSWRLSSLGEYNPTHTKHPLEDITPVNKFN